MIHRVAVYPVSQFRQPIKNLHEYVCFRPNQLLICRRHNDCSMSITEDNTFCGTKHRGGADSGNGDETDQQLPLQTEQLRCGENDLSYRQRHTEMC